MRIAPGWLLPLTLALGVTACGQPVTVATWMNADPGAELTIDFFGFPISRQLEGGVFTIIRLDLSNPLMPTGTIEVPQVRLAAPGLVCIRKDTSVAVNGSLEINVLTGEQNVDFPLAVIAGGSLFPGEFSGVGSPPPGSIQFPIDASLLEPILETGSLDGQLALPITLDQTFEIGTFDIPATVQMTLRSASRPPAVSAAAATECAARWALQGSALDYTLNARGTYLHTQNDDRRDPQVIDLASLGVVPGDQIRLSRKGSFADALAGRKRIAAVFSATSNLRSQPIGGFLWWFNPSRLPDAVNAGGDVFTPRTLWFQVPTDIKEDFEVGDDTVVTVPPGAAYLYFTPIDDHFDENFSFDLHVGVDRMLP